MIYQLKRLFLLKFQRKHTSQGQASRTNWQNMFVFHRIILL